MNAFSIGRFIWIKKKDTVPNRYLVFQKVFRLADPPTSARLKISAYSHYQVALNGNLLGRGPDPSNHRRYYYDVYNVRASLRRGQNVITVLAYAFGPELPWPETAYLPGESGWLIFELECLRANGRTVCLGSDDTWRVRPADAWAQRTSGYTELRAAYKEYYDANKFGYDGLYLPDAGGGGRWASAVELAPADLIHDYAFHPKEIKPFRYRDHYPVAAYSIDGGFAYGFTKNRGWQIENPEALVKAYPVGRYYEMLHKGEPNFPKGRLKTAAGYACAVHRVAGIGDPSLWIDFGSMQYGFFCLELETSAAGSVVNVGYGESPNITYIDRYTTRPGRQVFSPFHNRAGRYMILTFSKIAAPIRIWDLRFRHCDYPARERGSFSSSSALLDRIRTTSIRTLRLNMHSHFEDCPWREQKLYVGDLYAESLACYYSLGEYAYVKKNLQQLTAYQAPDGWVSSAGPGCSRGGGPIVDFPLYFVFVLRDYYLFSGDRQTLAGLYPLAVAQLNRYRDMGLRREGLLNIGKADTFSNWCFINWGDVVKKGQCAPLNFLLARGLAAAMEMATWLNKPEECDVFRKTFDALRRATASAFWDSARGLYRDGRFNGRPIAHYTTETNTLALLSGIPDLRQTRRILDALQQGRLALQTPTAFFNAFVADALFRNYRTAPALRLIEEYWGQMLQHGANTFWEMFLPETPPAGHPPKYVSLCHGWSSGPAFLLPAYVLGIRPIQPGFRTFTVDPQLQTLTSVAGIVPTPHGPISFSYESGTLSIRHPPLTTPVISKRRHFGTGTKIILREEGPNTRIPVPARV
ncbi:MAG: alpha-L-rhamnosidase N-terminal domain-containing protein [Verrucomicrobia bacterium]|nr:alpha-L-rhamnosidase N-terminal domain-containing protein [Verrucomicrobiota bacterium]